MRNGESPLWWYVCVQCLNWRVCQEALALKHNLTDCDAHLTRSGLSLRLAILCVSHAPFKAPNHVTAFFQWHISLRHSSKTCDCFYLHSILLQKYFSACFDKFSKLLQIRLKKEKLTVEDYPLNEFGRIWVWQRYAVLKYSVFAIMSWTNLNGRAINFLYMVQH